MKKSFFIALIAATALGSVACASGIPTFDAAAFAQQVQEIQYLQNQYNTLKQQYAAVTGSYGRGHIGLSDAINASQIVPGSWQDIVNQQNNGAFGVKQAYYEQQINTLPPSSFQDPQSQRAMDYKSSTDSVRASLAGGDVLYAETQTHLNNITTLSQQIDSTTNVKDAQDLQNRIAAESAMLNTAQTKLTALNVNLAANQLNEQNQADALNQSFFAKKSTQ